MLCIYRHRIIPVPLISLTEAIKSTSASCLHRKLRRAFASAAGADVICAVTKQLTHMCAAA
jgi:hypothetical protein